MEQISHTLPFFPLVSPGEGILSPSFQPTWIVTPPPKTTQVAGSKNVYEHLDATNTELEDLIARLGVPKTKAMLLQHEEQIEFRRPVGNAYRTMPKENDKVRSKAKASLRKRIRRSVVNLNPILAQTQNPPGQENQEGSLGKGKAKCLKGKSPINPKLLMNFIIWNARGQTVENLEGNMLKRSICTNRLCFFS